MVRKAVIMSTINKEVIDAFVSTLQDLTVNSKPLINVLTMIADENEPYSKNIVEAIETHLSKVRLEVKLPILYLIDCIIKNVGRSYMQHFCQNIVTTFCDVFQVVDEKTRAEMFKLRQTWNDVLPKAKLYAMDVQIRQIDPAWPITTRLHPIATNTIHVNPKFLNANNTNSIQKKDGGQAVAAAAAAAAAAASVAKSVVATPPDPATLVMQQKLLIKQKELVELQQKKIELELLQTKVKLEEEKLKSQLVGTKPISKPDAALMAITKPSHNLLLKPEVAKQLDNNSKDQIAMKPSHKQFHSSYTIPKQQQQQVPNNRTTATRDPRLMRLQQQQQQQQASIATSADSTTNIVSSTPVPATLSDIKRFNQKKQHERSPNKLGGKRAKSDSSQKSTNKMPSDKASRNKLSNRARNAAALPGSPASSSSSTTSSVSGGSPLKSAKAAVASANVEPQQGGKFRDLKGASKRRNYVRRNNDDNDSSKPDYPLDESPPGTGGGSSRTPQTLTATTGDTDLRSLDSLGGTSTTASSNNDNNRSPKLDLALKGVDVDLRQIPASTTAAAAESKKRSSNSDLSSVSSAADSPPAKKSKSQVLDALFGSEDVDLRQSTATTTGTATRASTPPPPPPPIISTEKQPVPVSAVAAADVAACPEPKQPEQVKKANLDALRAKLANVSNKEKLKEQNKKKQQIYKATTIVESLDSAMIRRIIMSSDDVDSIKAGKLSKEQETALMAKIKSHFENEKLAQAKLKEKETERVVKQSVDEVVVEQQQQQQPPPPQSRKVVGDSDSDDDEVVEVSLQGKGQSVPSGRFPQRSRQVAGRRDRLPHPPWRGGRGGGGNRWDPLPPWQQQQQQPQSRWSDNVVDRPPPLPQPLAIDHIIPPPPMPPPAIDITQPELHDQQPMLLQCTSPSDARSINIDGCPRDIRFYDEHTAIVFMSWDDPREISFQHGGPPRRIVFDDVDVFLMSLNDPEWTEVSINGQMHRIRLGAPTRELWVDGLYYEAIFGGKAVPVEVDGRMAMVRLEGPPPQVRIGTDRRTDLVCGKIQLIIDAKTIIPVFLDARVQQISINDNKNKIHSNMHTLQFVDSLRAVRFDGGTPNPVEFGGLPKPVHIARRKHFVRFSVLPRGVRPGHVRIHGMEGGDDVVAAPMLQQQQQQQPVLPHIPSAEELAGVPLAPPIAMTFSPSSAMDENSQDSQQNLGGNFDALSNAANVSLNTSGSEYQVEGTNTTNNIHQQLPFQQSTIAAANQHVNAQQQQQSLIVGNSPFNINDLFQKLLATGIVSTQPQLQPPNKPEKAKVKPREPQEVAPSLAVVYPVDWNKADTLKTRQSGLVQVLYSGMQCSSCGERFPTASGGSRLFSQHLDWHFRQNRRGKTTARNRKTTSRRWYYSLADWKQYEEIEDLRERAEKNFFENQQQQHENDGESSKDADGQQSAQNLLDQGMDVMSSVACDPDTTDPHCVVCEDRFEQFYNEELEEWHLRNAMAVDGQIYHPVCYKDQQTAKQTATAESSAIPGLDDANDVSHDLQGDEAMDSSNSVEEVIQVDLDEDQTEMEADETTSEVELIEPLTDNGGANADDGIEPVDDDDDDDDVILNEVQPEQIILDEYEWRSGEEPAAAAPTEIGLIPGVVVKVEPLDDGFMDVGDSLQKTNEPAALDGVAESTASTEGGDTDTAPLNGERENENDGDKMALGAPAEQEDSSHAQLVQQGDGKQQRDTEPTPPTASTAAAAEVVNIEDNDVPATMDVIPSVHADAMMANMDGNINTTAATSHGSSGVGRIRINISKAHAHQPQGTHRTAAAAAAAAAAASAAGDKTTEQQQHEKMTCDDVSSVSVVQVVDPSQPLPPGEEPPLKPALRGLSLRRQPPVHAGTELTGLCSIM